MSTWTTFWVKIWRGESVRLRDKPALDYIKSKTCALSGVFQSAIDWTPEGSRVFIDEMGYWVPVPWDNLSGRATLAGDAAHPMLICESARCGAVRCDAMRVNSCVTMLTDARAYCRPRTGVSALHHRRVQLHRWPDAAARCRWLPRIRRRSCKTTTTKSLREVAKGGAAIARGGGEVI